MQGMIVHYFSLGVTTTEITLEGLSTMFLDGCIVFAQTALPLLLITGLVAVVVTMAQTRMLFSAKAFAFKGERLNPLKGLKKMVELRSWVELVKALLKIILLVVIIYLTLDEELLRLSRLMDMSPLAAMSTAGSLILDIVLAAGVIFAFLAAADYLFQWWQYEKNLRMSKHEIKDEYKQMEGDPQVKGRLRQLQQQRARRRMMQQVPTADVVIKNPTHFAVAIRYEQGKDQAPRVVAKGQDALAMRIIALAEEHAVHIEENPPLARALYATVKLEQQIPGEFYKAIAEILAFLYREKKRDWRTR